MIDLLNLIKKKTPRYNQEYEDLILSFTLEQGGRLGTFGTNDKVEAWQRGMFFSNKYEMYMYATMLGLNNDHYVELEDSSKKKKFIEILYWKPPEIADFLVMSIFVKMDIDLFEIENYNDSELDRFISEVISTMEGYSNGGFDIIKGKKSENEDYFYNNENSFIDLLHEQKIEV